MPDLAFLLTPVFAIAAAVAFAGAILRGFTGFGANLILAPVYAVLFGPVEAVQLVVIISVIAVWQIFVPAAKVVDWREIAPMIGAAIVLSPLGVWALLIAEPAFVRRAMGVFVLIAAAVLLTGWSYKGPRGPIIGAAVGGLGGFITGFASIGGPIPVLYFMSAPGEARVQRANNVISVAVFAPVTLAVFVVTGTLTLETVFRAIVLTIPYMAGLWSGTRLFTVAPAAAFRWIVLGILAAIGVGALVF
jgi:hypothetical protein